MKIKVKGFKSLYKAVRNRAHLFPVKKLINGKTKTFYATRYVSSGEAMAIAKQVYKINPYQEAVFESKDGKRKNISEKEVLQMYDAAGKPGILQEFIKKNFKRPKVKASTKDNGQLSLNDLMQGNKKKTKEKELSLIELAEQKAQKLKEMGQAVDPRIGNTEAYKSKVTKEQVEEAKAFFNDKNTEIFPYDKGVRDDEGQFSDKEVVDAANLRMRMILEYNKKIEHEKNGLSDSYLNKEQLVRSYERYKIFEDILLNREEAAYWNEALKENKTELNKLQSFDERYMAKKRLEEKRAKRDKKEQKPEKENKKIILSRRLENAVRGALGAEPKKNKDDNWIYPANEILEGIIGFKDGKLNGKELTEKEAANLRNQYYNGHFNLETGKFSKTFKSDGPIQKQITDYIIDLIESMEKADDEQIDRLVFRSVGMNGGLINFINMRKGTTRVESKNEYKQVKNINELVDKIKPLKDSHTKIKGRAIMDMFGIGADLITKADGKPFPIGPGAAGYCSRYYNPETGEANIKEIGVASELYAMNNAYEETRVTIHECMHAKLTLSGKNNLMDSIYTSDTEGKEMSLKVEEPMVELAGHAVARQIHGDEANKSLHAYATFIADFLPRVWTSDIFKNVRKQGSLGIGQEIAKQLNSHNVDFINKVYDSFNANDDKRANSNRIKAIETKMLERTDKVEKIQNDTGVSSIAYLVEELKKGTISLEGALNSSQYRELAAVLIAKFLEDEDLEALEGLALSF